MPILVTGEQAASTPVRSTATPFDARPARWVWTPASGADRDLSSGDAYLTAVTGHLAPPVSLYESTPPTIDGGVYRGERYEPRDVGLGLKVNQRTAIDWRDVTRSLVRDFLGGAGVLSEWHADGQVRSLRCKYMAGLEAPDAGDPGAVPISDFSVILRAYDPWWYGPVQTRSFTQAAETDFLPGPPFTIMPTELLGSGTVVANPGDVAAYPVWTLTGPMTQASLTAEDGSTFTITYSLDAGESLVVDTDPRTSAFAKITDASGNNLWGLATADYPNLWALPAGESTVTVATSGTSTASSVLLQFNPRYYTA